MPLQATSGAASYDAFGGGVPAAPPTYIEDVFSTWLYTGTSAAQTITNNIDLSTKGGLFWLKNRTSASFPGNYLFDTERGAANALVTDTTAAQSGGYGNAFTTTGFQFTGGDAATHQSGINYASWTFRKQPKFFDVVTYTGDGASNRAISHNLGSTPGCFIVKRTDAGGTWAVWHRSLGDDYYLALESTQQAYPSSILVRSATSTTFSVGSDATVNASGGTYVAYLFAHNAGGFGLTGTDNVISCGSYTTDGSGNATVNLGYEPQWLMTKASSTTSDWRMFDNMRGFVATGDSNPLAANSSRAEDVGTYGTGINLTSTGFKSNATSASQTFIYIAIRRGPMKVPTDATKVFKPQVVAGSSAYSVGFPTDLCLAGDQSGNALNTVVVYRLAGNNAYFGGTASTAAEQSASVCQFDLQDSFALSYNSNNQARWHFRRAPSFFDEVCYTGTGSSQNVSHNLAAVPELLIIKRRDSTGNWEAAVPSTTAGSFFVGTSGSPISLNTTNGNGGQAAYAWASNTGTATYFNPSGIFWNGNASGGTYVAYLFATCAGVSKVGSVTHVEPTTVSCGFTPRFVMLKSTTSTGTDDLFVFDSARGIVTGNDPYLRLNSTGAENTPFGAGDLIDATADGFIMNGFGGGTYIFLAIA